MLNIVIVFKAGYLDFKCDQDKQVVHTDLKTNIRKMVWARSTHTEDEKYVHNLLTYLHT
jgi:hypothetical protein